MSNSIENLLLRNLYDVFGERDPQRRMAAIRTLFDAECLFSDPRGRHRGHEALERAVIALQSEFPDHAFTQIGSVASLQDSGKLAWAFGPPDEPRQITGLDVIVVQNDRIASLFTFVDPASA